MTFDEFHNALRILLNIDFDQFEQALADSPEAAEEEWQHFQINPYRYFISADDSVSKALFAIIHERNAGTRQRLGSPFPTHAELTSIFNDVAGKSGHDPVGFIAADAVYARIAKAQTPSTKAQ